VAATYAGVIGGTVPPITGNTSPTPISWDETAGRVMVLVYQQGRLLSGSQTQGPITHSVTGWAKLAERTVVANDDTGGKDRTFVSQAIFWKMGAITLGAQTGEVVHDGLDGGFQRCNIYGFDAALVARYATGQQGIAANPTDAQTATAATSLAYLTAYADSSGSSPSWSNLNSFTQVLLANRTRLGSAIAYRVSAPTSTPLPRVQGASVNLSLNRFPFVQDSVSIGPAGTRRPGHYLGLRR